MKKKVLTVLRYSAFLLLGIFLLFLAFRGINLGFLVESLKNANYWWVGLAQVFAFIGYLSRAARWKILIDPMGKPVSFSGTYHAVALGYLANFAFPRLGEVTRCASLSKTDKVSLDKLLGTVIAERAFDLLMLVFLMVFLIIFKFEMFGSFLKSKVLEPLFGKLTSAFALPMSFWLVAGSIVLLLILAFLLFRDKFVSNRHYQKLLGLIKGVFQGFTTVFRLKKTGWFIFHTLFLWANYAAMTYVICFAIPSTSGLTLIDGIFILVVGSLGMSAPVQGGFGAFHWIVSLGLTLFGLTREEGLVYATISHESQAVFVIVLGAISFFVLSFSRKKKSARS